MSGTFDEWESLYSQARPEDLPWFTPRLDPDVDEVLARLRVTRRDGPLLDLGTGPGTVAIELARRGLEVVALDVSESAIAMARRRAGDLAPNVRWIVGDLFEQTWEPRFQVVLDRGVYHSLPGTERERYPEVVAPWLKPGGHLVLKTFSPDEPGDWGPHRITRQELETNLGGRLELRSLASSRFQGTLDHEPRAWLAVFRRAARP